MTKCLHRLSEPGTGLHTTPPSARVQTLHKASLVCKHVQNYTLSILQFLSCKHVCIYMFMTPFNPYIRKPVRLQRDWKSAIFVSAAGARLTLDEYSHTQKCTKATWPLLLAALCVCSASNSILHKRTCNMLNTQVQSHNICLFS